MLNGLAIYFINSDKLHDSLSIFFVTFFAGENSQAKPAAIVGPITNIFFSAGTSRVLLPGIPKIIGVNDYMSGVARAHERFCRRCRCAFEVGVATLAKSVSAAARAREG